MPITCLYVYPDNHKTKAGVRCPSPVVCKDEKRRDFGYCYGHASKEKLIDPDAEKLRKSKTKETKQKAREEKYGVDFLGVTTAQVEKVGKKQAEMLLRAKEIFERVLDLKHFSLSRMASQATQNNGALDQEAKKLFVFWWLSDPVTRVPETLKKVSGILRVTEYALRNWLTEDWFLKEIELHRLNMMKVLAPEVDKQNMIQALTGEGKSKDLFYKQIGLIRSEDPDKPPDKIPLFPAGTEKLLEKAEKITKINENKSKKIILSEEDIAKGMNMSALMPIDQRASN